MNGEESLDPKFVLECRMDALSEMQDKEFGELLDWISDMQMPCILGGMTAQRTIRASIQIRTLMAYVNQVIEQYNSMKVSKSDAC